MPSSLAGLRQLERYAIAAATKAEAETAKMRAYCAKAAALRAELGSKVPPYPEPIVVPPYPKPDAFKTWKFWQGGNLAKLMTRAKP